MVKQLMRLSTMRQKPPEGPVPFFCAVRHSLHPRPYVWFVYPGNVLLEEGRGKPVPLAGVKSPTKLAEC